MHVIFETPPVATTIARRTDGKQGRAYLQVLHFDADEEPFEKGVDPKAMRAITWRLSDLRAAAGSGNPIIVRPPPMSALGQKLGPVTIPESVLAALPADAKLQFRWTYDVDGRW